jgi:hypothetical protein
VARWNMLNSLPLLRQVRPAAAPVVMPAWHVPSQCPWLPVVTINGGCFLWLWHNRHSSCALHVQQLQAGSCRHGPHASSGHMSALSRQHRSYSQTQPLLLLAVLLLPLCSSLPGTSSPRCSTTRL